MELKHPPSSIPVVKELIALLEPYAQHWHEWIESGASFFSPRELIIIRNFLLHGTHTVSAKQLKIKKETLDYILWLSMIRIRNNHPQFQQWLTEKLLEESGVISYNSKQDRFLHSPLLFLNIPYDLKYELRQLNEHCIADILTNYTEINLRSLWFTTRPGIRNLKKLLQVHDCLHLLK